MANKFKKGDEVIVVTGSSKGKIGKITSILSEKALVEGAFGKLKGFVLTK